MVEVHASMTRPMLARLVQVVAEDRGMTFREAALFLARRWEDAAMYAKENRYITWQIWDEMGMMALTLEREDGLYD